jgi:hypothetical protein
MFRLAKIATAITAIAITPPTGRSRAQPIAAGEAGGGPEEGACGIDAVISRLPAPALKAGAPASAIISGRRQVGQTVSPFPYQVQQLRQTA